VLTCDWWGAALLVVYCILSTAVGFWAINKITDASNKGTLKEKNDD